MEATVIVYQGSLDGGKANVYYLMPSDTVEAEKAARGRRIWRTLV